MKNVDYLNEEIAWNFTDNPEYPYQSVHNEKNLLIRLNDFPAEHLYTLIADGQEITDFDDWATTWNRVPKTAEKNSARNSSTAKATATETSARTYGKAKSLNYSVRKG